MEGLDERGLRSDSRSPLAEAHAARLSGTNHRTTSFRSEGYGTSGTLKLVRAHARVRAVCRTEVVLAPSRLAGLVRIALQPAVAPPDSIELYSSVPVAAPWKWRTLRGTNEIRETERLHAAEAIGDLLGLGTGNPLQAINVLVVRPQGSLWRMKLAQPLKEPVTLEADFDLMQTATEGNQGRRPATADQQSPSSPTRGELLKPPGPRWEVPLIAVLSAERTGGEVTLHLARSDAIQLETRGLEESATSAPPGSSSAVRVSLRSPTGADGSRWPGIRSAAQCPTR